MTALFPIGRVFDSGQLTGFIMPRETPIALSGMPGETPINVTKRSPGARLRIINQLHGLVRRLHFKNIIHGDIKPSNLLLCTDGELRFCDFRNVSIEGDQDKLNGFTQHYCSPSRVSGDSERPCTRSDDFYAVGISMWEIFTGNVTFSGIPHDVLDDLIAGGLRPDLTLVNNHNIARLITSYLDAGPPLSKRVFQTEAGCMEAEISFKDFREAPPHTYKKTVHSLYCVEEGRKTCPKTYDATRRRR
jgi:serine/threonine protein kinase